MVERAVITSVLIGAVAILVVDIGRINLFDSTAARLGENPETANAGDVTRDSKRATNGSTAPTVQYARDNTAFDIACLSLSVCIACLSLLLHWRRRSRNDDGEDETEMTVAFSNRKKLLSKRQEIYRILSNDLHHLFDGRILVKDVMSKDVQTVETTASREEVEKMMKAHQLHHLMVCDHGKLKGIISTNDLQNNSGVKAHQIMTPDPMSACIDEEITMPISTIINHRIACLPVVDNGQLRGVLTKTDLLVTLQCAIRVLHEIGDIMSTSVFKGHEQERVSADEIHKEFWKAQQIENRTSADQGANTA